MSSIGSTGRTSNIPDTDVHSTSTTTDVHATTTPDTLHTPSFAANATLRAVLANRATIAYGARDRDAAKLVQQGLVDLGFLARSPGADGVFGNATLAAVKAFQSANGLHADGVVGPNTLRKLDEKLAARATPAPAPQPPAPAPQPPAPTPVTPVPTPASMRVLEGTSKYSLDDDTLMMTGEGKFTSSIGREIYTAGYLPMKEGPMLSPMGTAAKDRSVLSADDNKFNKEKSAVERLDEAMKRATGTAGKLTDKYKTEGKRDEADSWWGFCDRWSYNALDPAVATKVDKPIYYQGMYFSTAELRGLATFTGRSDEAGGMFDKDVTPLDLQKATTMFLKENGPGFISDVWLDSAHPGNSQVWNQPFDAVDQSVKEMKGDDLAKALKDQFGLEGAAAAGKKVYYVETTGHYGVETGDGHEGAATHATKTWKSYIVTDADGKALDGKWAKGSDDAPEYIWMPNRSGQHTTKEAKFFRDMLQAGVPAEKVEGFEKDLAALPANASAAQKSALVAKYKGVAGAFPAAALASKLQPYGINPADLK